MSEVQRILGLLQSKDPEEIREGAFLAGEERLVEAIIPLVQLIEAGSAATQEAVENALLKLASPKVVPALVPLLRSEAVPARNTGLSLLRQIGSLDTKTLIALLGDADDDVRISAADLLGYIDNTPAVVIGLCEVLVNDKQVNVRQQAAVSLGRIKNPDAAPYLKQALSDEEEWVQFAAIEALSLLRHEDAVTSLLVALADSSELIQFNIIEALGEIGDIKSAPVLLNLLETSPAPLCNAIVKALVHILGEKSLHLLGNKAVKKFHEYLLFALEDEAVETQDAAIRGLAVVGEEKASASILDLASQLNPDVEMERLESIITALARIGMTKAIAEALKLSDEQRMQVALAAVLRMENIDKVTLLKQLFWDTSRTLQRIVIAELARFADREDQSFFIEVIERHTDSNILRESLTFLGNNGTSDSIVESYLIEYLVNPYDDVKEAALMACVALRSTRLIEHLFFMLKSQDAEQRMMAVFALGSIDSATYLEHLTVALHDNSGNVRKVALQMLGSIQTLPQKAQEYILGCFDDEDSNVRMAVVDTLDSFSDEIVKEILLKGLNDKEAWVQIRCIEQLVSRNADWAVEELVTSLASQTNNMVVLRTVEALGEIGGEVAFRTLFSLLSSEDATVQSAAESAIESIQNKMRG